MGHVKRISEGLKGTRGEGERGSLVKEGLVQPGEKDRKSHGIK